VATVTLNKPRVDEEALRHPPVSLSLQSEALSDQELVTNSTPHDAALVFQCFLRH
jgi:hypothetical protein